MRQQRFSLQTVQTMRKADRDTCQHELTTVQQRREQILQQQKTLDARWLDWRDERRDSLDVGEVDLTTLRDVHRSQRALRAEQDRLDREIEAVNADVESCRSALIQAERQLRMLDKLEAREQAQRQVEHQLHRRRELDDLQLRSTICRREQV